MIVVHETTNPYISFFRLLSYMYEYKFVTLIYNILDDREWVDVTEGITPSDVLPHDWSYFTYQGSLTTPPCYETVTWINMRCPIKVSRRVGNLISICCKRFISLSFKVWFRSVMWFHYANFYTLMNKHTKKNLCMLLGVLLED